MANYTGALELGLTTLSQLSVDTTEAINIEPYHAIIQLEYVYFSIHLLILLASLFGNSLALAALLTTTSNLYPWFFNLVLADLLKTLICMPYSLYIIWEYDTYRTNNPPTPPLCAVEGFVFLVSMMASLMSSVAISIDRVIAITRPMLYAGSQRKVNPVLLIAGSWVLVVSICFVPFFFNWAEDGYIYSHPFIPTCHLEIHNMVARAMDAEITVKIATASVYTVIVGIPIFIVCTNCSIVCFKLFKNSTVHNSPNVSLGGEHENTVSVGRDMMELLHSPQQHPRPRTRKSAFERRQRLQKQAGITMTLVAVTFLMCHISFLVMWIFWEEIGGTSCGLPSYGQPSSKMGWSYGVCVSLHTVQITLVYLNAPLNVVIYYCRCSYLRRQILNFLTAAKNFFSSVLQSCWQPWGRLLKHNTDTPANAIPVLHVQAA